MGPDRDSFRPEALESMIADSGASYRESGQSYIFDCPRCGKKNKLYIRKRDGAFRCWVCEAEGFRGRAEYALTELLGLGLPEIRRRLYQWTPNVATEGRVDLAALGLSASEDDFTSAAEEEPLPEVSMPPGTVPLDHPHARRGLDYLRGRPGPVDIDACRTLGLGYCPSLRRVMTPLVMHGRLVGYQGRTVLSTEPRVVDGKLVKLVKTMTSENLARDRLVCFHDSLIGSPHGILFEGPFDAIQAHRCGGAVATLGKVVSASQIALVSRAGCRRLYVGLDDDAVDATARIVRNTADDFEEGVWWMRPTPGLDFGAMPPEAVLEAFHAAERVSLAHVFVAFG